MKYLIYLISSAALCSSFSLLAKTDYRTTVITDPSISIRCTSLIKKRNEKIEYKQKIKSLIQRNKKLVKALPKNKASVRSKLIRNRASLGNELELALTKIQHLEENVVRQGCPGLSL